MYYKALAIFLRQNSFFIFLKITRKIENEGFFSLNSFEKKCKIATFFSTKLCLQTIIEVAYNWIITFPTTNANFEFIQQEFILFYK